MKILDKKQHEDMKELFNVVEISKNFAYWRYNSRYFTIE